MTLEIIAAAETSSGLGVIAEEFVESQRREGLWRPKHLGHMTRVTEAFIRWAGPDRDPATVSTLEIDEWLTTTPTDGGVGRRVDAVRELFGWMLDNRVIDKDPTTRITGGVVTAKDRRLGQVAVRYAAGRRARREIAENTVRQTRIVLVRFARTVGWDLPTDRLRRSHIERYLEGLRVGDGTRRHYVSIIRTFCAWLADNGYTRRDPAAEVPMPKVPRRLPRALRHDQVVAAFRACPDLRTQLVFLLGVQLGLRVGEIATLQRGDIDHFERMLRVVGKGDKERALPIDDETYEVLVRYIDQWPGRDGPVIRSESEPHKGISGQHITHLLKAVFFDAGVKRRCQDGVSTHALRHTAATDMMRNGAHLRDIQRALGHSSLQVTERYLALEVKDLREAMGGRSYRAEAVQALAEQ